MLISVLLLVNIVLRSGSCSKVLLFSIDGFRFDYLNSTLTPQMWEFAEAGLRADYMLPVFITKTFPNHWSIVTGVYQEQHGIISNSMYDPDHSGERFKLSDHAKPFWWNEVEPIWNQLIRDGRRAGTFFWPGAEVMVRGIRPSFYRRYTDVVPFDHRVETLLEWLLFMDVELATLYISEPDTVAHDKGPDSPEVIAMLKKIDTDFGKMLRRFNETGILSKLNIIVVGDHGMSKCPLDQRFFLNQNIDVSLINASLDNGPTMQLWPKGDAAVLAKELNDAFANRTNCTAYLKANIPDEFHYKNHKRVPPILILCNEGYTVYLSPQKNSPLGDHGYSNKLVNMRTVFFGGGPNIARGRLSMLDNVDIYPFLCDLLNVKPHPFDGSAARLRPYLVSAAAHSWWRLPRRGVLAVGLLVAAASRLTH